MTARTRAAAAFLVCGAAVVPYLSTLNNYFVADDFGVVALLSEKPASYFPRWFVSSWMDRIWGTTNDEVRPFPAASYQAMAVWGAASPVANHILNIALHAANALLVLAIGRVAGRLSLAAATFAALVFALLPFQAESVAWITGRVDSMPTFFYLASFLAYASWTRWHSALAPFDWRYAISLVFFFMALFSKQNAVTLPVALVLYDLLVERVSAADLRLRVWSYIPYWLLTGGYLLLRFLVFGEIARESQLSREGVERAGYFVSRHLRREVFGEVDAASPLAWVVVALAITGVWWLWWRSRLRAGTPRGGVAAFFGPVWWILGVAPLVVVAYESPRHIHLASAGWAVLLGFGFDVTMRAGHRKLWRLAVVLAGVAVLGAHGRQLVTSVNDWNARALVSRRAVADLEREALAAPQHSLILVGAPDPSWEFALPFAARPPYARSDLTAHVFLMSPRQLYCCPEQWHADTLRILEQWSARPGSAAIALHWDPRTGALSRLTDRENPDLRTLLEILQDVNAPDALDRNIRAILTQLVARP